MDRAWAASAKETSKTQYLYPSMSVKEELRALADRYAAKLKLKVDARVT